MKSMKYRSTAPSAALTPACLLHASREYTWSLQCCCTLLVVFLCVFMFTVAQNLFMGCKCQSCISLLLTQMPQASCVAGKGTFYSNDFNVSYYLYVASWHDYQSLSIYYQDIIVPWIHSTTHNENLQKVYHNIPLAFGITTHLYDILYMHDLRSDSAPRFSLNIPPSILRLELLPCGCDSSCS